MTGAARQQERVTTSECETATHTQALLDLPTLYRRPWPGSCRGGTTIVDGHQDLPSDGHEVGAVAIAESDWFRWSLRR